MAALQKANSASLPNFTPDHDSELCCQPAPAWSIFILNVSSLLLSSDEENTAVQISVATGQALRSVFAF